MPYGGRQMKVYFGFKKHPTKDNKTLRCMSVYDNTGKLLDNVVETYDSATEHKYDEALITVAWGVNKLKSYVEYNYAQMTDKKVDIFIPFKTVYSWFEKETSPKQYLSYFSDVVIDISLIHLDEVTINYMERVKVNFDNDTEKEEDASGIADFFADFEERQKVKAEEVLIKTEEAIKNA